MKRIVAFGEAMVRLTTPLGVPLEAATEFNAPVGGAELNVAIAARRQGMDAVWVSTLPAGPLGEIVVRHAAAQGVKTVLRRLENTRVGLYFLEQAVPPRSSRVVYDRGDTAFVRQPAPEMDWEELFDPESCLVVSGITPALGDQAAKAVDDAIDTARVVGATVAVDVNYRATLWSIEEAFDWLRSVIDRVDVLAASRADLARLDVTGGTDIYEEAVNRLGLKAVVGSEKEIKGRSAHIGLHAATPQRSASTQVEAEVLNPLGSGDAMFGVFLACLGQMPLQRVVEKAAGAVVTAYGLSGDALTTDPWSPDEQGGVKR